MTSRGWTRPLSARRLLGALAAVGVVLAASAAWAGSGQAPFGDKVGAAIRNYNRALPQVGTSGAYPAAALAEVKALGFAALIDLRGPKEAGVAGFAEAAKAAGLTYYAIPVTTKTPGAAQVAAFAKLVEDPANQPVLVNCQSANRVGAMWALYRASKGVPAKVALEEGRTAGLTSREPAVRAALGLPAMSQ